MRLVAVLLITFGIAAEPRPIHDAEREAVAIAAAFLTHGPEELWSRLAADAPLRTLAKADAVREIAARTGPREHASWTLQTTEGATDAAFRVRWPSGYDDGLLFRMKREGGVWRLHELRTLGEPDVGRASARPEAEGNVGRASARPGHPLETNGRAEARPPDNGRAEARPTLIIGSAVFAVMGVVFRRRPLIAAACLASALALGVAAAMMRTAARAPELPFVELRALAEARAQLARGEMALVPRELSPAAREVVKLWLGHATANGTPLAELVRARIALADDDNAAARAAFDRAAAFRPQRDDILHEAAVSLDDPRFFARMRALGSRDAAAYYAERSYEAFRTAWMLEPKLREELIRDPDLFPLLADLRVRSMVSYYSASEPARRTPKLATRALAWPAGARAFVCGERLRVEIGSGAIEVPNGAVMAPRDAQVVSAAHGGRRRDATALREAQELLEGRGAPARTLLVRAVAALARHNRWSDVLKLTDEDTPPELLPVRIRALLRAGRVDEARRLSEEKGQDVDDPVGVLAIADAMTNAGQWSTAETLFRSVTGEKHEQLVNVRLRQIALRRALAVTAQTIATPHFDIRHDPAINPAIASRIGDLLEAELARLRQKLPPVELRRVTVNVLHWREFRADLTQSDHILGLYDGEILFPFAAVEQFKPEVVAVITHELAHAIVAQATADNAPRWFQEGVATRMELVERQENVFSETPPALVLPVTLLDAVMERNADPSAYVVAQTFIRFLEARYGSEAIATLAAEFARGTNSDDALMKLAGKPLEALDAEFRQWGFHNNGDFVMNEPWPYRHLYSPGIDPRIREGFRWRE